MSYLVADEDDAISVNYTSGTTGKPKGVVYTHRGAYLNSLGEVIHQGLVDGSSYLWTLPMFHCNGWCTTWALTAVAGTHVCLRATRADDIWRLIDHAGVSHMAGAPTVLSMMKESPLAHPLRQALTVTTAGAPPSPSIIAAFADLNVTGGARLRADRNLWSVHGVRTAGLLAGSAGRGTLAADGPSGSRHDHRRRGESRCHLRALGRRWWTCPADGVTMGEIVMRGNTVMKEYFRDPDATAEAFSGGWFHSGDLGVRYPDGYIQLMDRAKDIVISGGENISTVEVEHAFLSHPAVADVAVIAVPDERWGERPKAFVVLAAGRDAGQAELIDHVKEHIAKFKAPKVGRLRAGAAQDLDRQDPQGPAAKDRMGRTRERDPGMTDTMRYAATSIEYRRVRDQVPNCRRATIWRSPGATDFYSLDELLTDEERELRDRVRVWCDTEVAPAAAGYWERAEFPVELAKGYGRLGHCRRVHRR